MKQLVFDFISLITILNPLAAAAILVTLAEKEEIPAIARKAFAALIVAMIVTMFGGEFVFKIFGINLPSIKAIGGVVLLIIALHMVQGNERNPTSTTVDEHAAAQEKDEIAIIPLTIPILFGPGVITTIIVLNNKAATLQDRLFLVIAIFLSSIVTYIVLRNAKVISDFLGVNGLKVLTRLMGLIIGAIAFLFLVNGIKHLWIAS